MHLYLFPSYTRSVNGGAVHARLEKVLERLREEWGDIECTWVLPADMNTVPVPHEEITVRVLPWSFLAFPGEGMALLEEGLQDASIFVLEDPTQSLLIAAHDVLSRYPKGELIVIRHGQVVRHRPKCDPIMAHEPISISCPSREDATSEQICDQVGLRVHSSAMQDQVDAAYTLAKHAVPVLLLGETGTGKSLLARFIHQASPRSRNPLISLNCAALPEKLAESVLFGHRKGAFTGAVDHQDGLFREAHQSSLFLDEVGELSMELQAKLLRVLEDGYVQPVGSGKGTNVDVRILAATNRDLQQEVSEGRFREDLYHRLSFGVLRLPPLRDRPDDVGLLAEQFLRKFNTSLAEPRRLSPEAIQYLTTKSWPGNIRELENAVGRCALYAKDHVLTPAHFQQSGVADTPTVEKSPADPLGGNFSLEDHLKVARETLIQRALEQTQGNQSAAARLLGISPQAVHKFLKQHPDLNPNRN